MAIANTQTNLNARKKKRHAIVRHFTFTSLLSIADFKRLTVIDPYTDEIIQYQDKQSLSAAWSIDRYISMV